MQSISVFLDIAKFADCWYSKKNADVGRNQGVYYVNYFVFESFLGKV